MVWSVHSIFPDPASFLSVPLSQLASVLREYLRSLPREHLAVLACATRAAELYPKPCRLMIARRIVDAWEYVERSPDLPDPFDSVRGDSRLRNATSKPGHLNLAEGDLAEGERTHV
jgi:hypothetical protein